MNCFALVFLADVKIFQMDDAAVGVGSFARLIFVVVEFVVVEDAVPVLPQRQEQPAAADNLTKRSLLAGLDE